VAQGWQKGENDDMEQEWADEWLCHICGIHKISTKVPAGYFQPFCVHCWPYVEQYMRKTGKTVDLLNNDDFIAIAKMRLEAFLGA
jgi:hypothetical protein